MYPQFWIPVGAMIAWLVASGTKAEPKKAEHAYLLLGREQPTLGNPAPEWKAVAITATKQRARDLLREIFTIIPELPRDTRFKVVRAEGLRVSMVVRRKAGYNFVLVAHRKGAAAREAVRRIRAELPDWEVSIVSAEVPGVLLTGVATV